MKNNPFNDPLVQKIFRVSAVLGSQTMKLFFILTCADEAACSQRGFATWMLKPSTFTHPYSWWWSWSQYPKGFYYIAAPYGPAWYILNAPAILGFLPWMFYLFTIDTMITAVLYRRMRLRTMILYALTSGFIVNYVPIDYFPFSFAVLGFYNPAFSVLAIMTKLPWAGPSYVWDFVLHSPASLQLSANWPRYAILLAWWAWGVRSWLINNHIYSIRLRTGRYDEPEAPSVMFSESIHRPESYRSQLVTHARHPRKER